ncbi:MAG: bifunctional glutamate N-acetyltransferase/amino-acid acetyltransferase ArgJ [Acidimicrobiia bacterium]
MSVTAPRGFVAGGVACGIRRRAPDLAVVRSIPPTTAAAMFTRNRVKAAPLAVSQKHMDVADPQAVVINSGVANAATGVPGRHAASATAVAAARLLGLAAEQVLVLSTGLIGVPLPVDKIRNGLAKLCPRLDGEGGPAAAEAIMTTDSHPKQIVVPGNGFTVGGMAKGAGMIHPSLATMLAVITTDYPLQRGEGIEFLRPAVEASFNRISVDGECSTNDAVILLANGAAGVPRDDTAFAAALNSACADLSRQIVADGEGSSVIIEIAVSGADTDEEAAAIARRVATSQLVKTAAFGRDPNWGRVLAAAGSATCNGGFARLDPDLLTLSFNGSIVFENGEPTSSEPSMADAVLRIDLGLGLGSGEAAYLASDLTYDYVRINAEYTT